MVFDVDKRLKVICSLVMLAAIAFMPLAGISDLEAQQSQTLQLAPTNPDFVKFFEEPAEPFYGYIPPPMDLSHVDEIPVERPQKATSLPGSFDWRDQGKVTPIKDQNPCGTCWVHGTLAAVESRVLIQESTEYDFSEQNLICCTDPAWVYLIGNRCMGGGWSWLAADTLTKKGTRLEACQPYNTDTINTEACGDSCQSIKMVMDFRMIANEATSPDAIEPIKNAIYNHGPLAMSYAADNGEHMHEGSIYYWPDCPANEVNHLVCIVGWDDTVAHPAGGGTGAWIVKNSWGTGWGDNGYFYLCYGSAGMCEVASLDYKDYDPNEKVYYWDEAGQLSSIGAGSDACWMANIFSSEQDGSLTNVDFWTTGNNAQYDIYVYLDGDISDGLQNQVASKSGTCEEYGYYSIQLSSPVSLANGQSFIIAVKMTTPGFNYPIPIEYKQVQGGETLVDPPIQSGKSYARGSDTDAWEDLAAYDCNTCLRGRVTSEAAGQPDITVSPTSFDETLPPNTTHDYTLTIGNTGDADLNYNISDADCPWLSESPTSGSVQPGNSATITVTMDTTGLAEGDYSAEIVIASNDPDEDPTIVPVTLHVGGVAPATAERSIEPDSVAAGGTTTVSVTITANQALSGFALDEDPPAGWTVTEVDNDGAIFNPAEVSWVWIVALLPGESKTVVYQLTVPASAAEDIYNTSGLLMSSGIEDIEVGGENTITVGEELDSWSYDEDNSGYIEIGELLHATSDYIGGDITTSQLLEIINLYISHTPKS